MPGEVGAGLRRIHTRGAPFHVALWVAQAVGRRALSVQKWKGGNYQRIVTCLLTAQAWDVVVIDHAQMAWILPQLPDVPIIYLAHHAEEALYARLTLITAPLESLAYRREAKFIGQIERKLLEKAAETWCISAQDADHLRPKSSGFVRVLPPLARKVNEIASSATTSADVALLGNWRWLPNRLALCWFIESVVPLLPEQWQIHIGGEVDLVGLPLATKLSFFGAVENGPAFLRGASRIAVPSLAAEGANLKLLDAIASGRPVVASASAARLLGGVPADIAVADFAREFAEKLLETPQPDLVARMQWMAKRQHSLDSIIDSALSEWQPSAVLSG
jgi:glycosyltransferase involved in cell wall biosynthesis